MLTTTINLIHDIMKASDMKVRRGWLDFCADRIRIATTQPTLLQAMEWLQQALQCNSGMLDRDVFKAFLTGDPTESLRVLAWLRMYPKVAIQLARESDEKDRKGMCEMLKLPELEATDGACPKRSNFDVTIHAKCLSPLAHGGDTKAGNATIFRRQDVLASNGVMLTLPYYGGNALRGQIRDILADHFVSSLGMRPNRAKPPVELWFFHCLYAGGALEENSKQGKVLDKELGGNGAQRATGIHALRDTLPNLSLLGTALGNRVLKGRIQVGELRPLCKQWGQGSADASTLLTWEFLTRREDHEDHDENHSMIANSEVLKTGTELEGGISIDEHANELERSALGTALKIWQVRGMLGAENRRGLGRVDIEIENAPDPEPYETYLREQRAEILGYLDKIKAVNKDWVNAHSDADSELSEAF